MRVGYDERLILNGFHIRNIKSQGNEILFSRRNLLPTIMTNILRQKDNHQYNERQISEFSRLLMNPVYYRIESFPFLGPEIKDMLPNVCKDMDNSNNFNNKFKKQKPENYPYRLCKLNYMFCLKNEKAGDIQIVFSEEHYFVASEQKHLFYLLCLFYRFSLLFIYRLLVNLSENFLFLWIISKLIN